MQVPWLFENLVRILALNDVQQARVKRNLADVYIRPPVESFNILGFASYEEIIEIGYETARAQIEQWLRTPDAVQVLGEPFTGPTQAAHEAEPTVSGLLGDALTGLEDVLKADSSQMASKSE